LPRLHHPRSFAEPKAKIKCRGLGLALLAPAAPPEIKSRGFGVLSGMSITFSFYEAAIFDKTKNNAVGKMMCDLHTRKWVNFANRFSS